MVLGQMGISKAVLKYSNIEPWIRDNSSVVLRHGFRGSKEIERIGFGLARP